MQKENITNALIFQARNIANLLIAGLAGIRVAAERVKASQTARKVCWGIIAALVLVLNSLISFRVAQRNELRAFEAWRERYVNDYLAQQEAAAIGMPPDPAELRRETQTAMLARVLYGVKDNSEQDLRTMCWCVFNRVDSPEFPDSLEEVIAQPRQWMRYSEENDVIDSLYKIAAQELDAWEHGKTRPVTADYVYMDWTPTNITLRNAWEYGRGTGTWRYGQ